MGASLCCLSGNALSMTVGDQVQPLRVLMYCPHKELKRKEARDLCGRNILSGRRHNFWLPPGIYLKPAAELELPVLRLSSACRSLPEGNPQGSQPLSYE